jgi:flagellar hook-associated protein 2
MASITSTGLGSGLDINGLVKQLVDTERVPKTSRLDTREGEIQAKISSLGNFKSAISVFRNSLSGLKTASSFQKISVSTSDSDVVTASAEKNADLGSYNIEVKQLAQSHALASGVYATADTVVGSGTLTIKMGTTVYDKDTDTYTSFTENTEKKVLTLNLDASNNTLTGLRDAINNAGSGINASIINDGSGFRLVVNSTDTGADNSLELSVSGDSDGDDIDNSGLSALNFNAAATSLEQTQTAQDANLTINGLTINSASNSVSSALKGLTFDLLKAKADQMISLNVTRDNAGVTESIEAFVKGYNELLTTVTDISGVDLSKKTAGVLVGDSMLRGALSRIRNEMTGFVEGLNGAVKSLSDVGVSFQRDGSLALDSSKLSKVLSSSPDEVAQLFTALGRSDKSASEYLSHGTETQAGNYLVEVSKAATPATIGGTSLTAGNIVIDTNNDTLRIKVDGTQSDLITLTQGSYTEVDLAAEIQARIDADTSIKQGSVKVTFDPDNVKFVLTAESLGPSSTLALISVGANTEATLGLTVGEASGEAMVATVGGSPTTVNGFEITAEGGPAKGLRVLVEENTAGSKGRVSFSRGVIGQLDRYLGSLLFGAGSIAERTDNLNKNLQEIENSRKTLDSKMKTLESRLFSQFNALDLLMARFQSTSNFLTQQLDNLPINNLNKKK